MEGKRKGEGESGGEGEEGSSKVRTYQASPPKTNFCFSTGKWSNPSRGSLT
jgi:hypothetical protein